MNAEHDPARPDLGANADRARAAGAAGLARGLTVGMLDISKARGNVFLDRIAARLGERGRQRQALRKPTFTRPAPTELKQQIAAECQLVVEGLAD